MPRLILYCTHEILIDDPLRRQLGELNSREVLKIVKGAIPEELVVDKVQIVSKPIPRQSPIWVGKCRVRKKECLWKMMRTMYE